MLEQRKNLMPEEHKLEEEISLSYQSKLRHVVIGFDPRMCLSTESPPLHLQEKTELRMKKALAAGHVEIFSIYWRELTSMWQTIRERLEQNLGVPERMQFVLAEGAPALRGLHIDSLSDAEHPLAVSIQAPLAELQSWRLEWLSLHLRNLLILSGRTDRPHPGHLQGVLHRARLGQRIDKVPIGLVREERPEPGLAFVLKANRLRREVSIHIYDLASVSNKLEVAKRMTKIQMAIRNFRHSPKSNYILLADDFIKAVDRELAGPKSIGVNMPLIVLVAIDPSPLSADAKAVEPSQKVATAPADFLPILRSPDEMSAAIDIFDRSLYDRVEITEQWVLAQCKAAGILYGIEPEFMESIIGVARARGDLRGQVVAKGTPAVVGQDPFLCLAPKQGQQLRSYRSMPTVKAGQLAAEVQYHQPQQDGTNVLGQSVPAPPGELLPVQVSEGITEIAPGKFQAQTDGVVKLENNCLSLHKILLHEGDVSLASGNIEFDGPVEITGNVDSGARVCVGGDLVIRGQVRRATVIANGNIQVQQGIVTGEDSYIKAKGDISAEFIENSRITCHGNLHVEKSILHGHVLVGKDIVVDSGLIGGGFITCGNQISANDIGLPEGSRTTIVCGVNMQSEVSLQLRGTRLERLLKAADVERKQLRELTRIKVSQLSAVKLKEKRSLQERVAQWKRITEQAQLRFEQAKSNKHHNAEAKIIVKGRISSNCEISIAGKAIPFTDDKMATSISAVFEDGSYFKPYSG